MNEHLEEEKGALSEGREEGPSFSVGPSSSGRIAIYFCSAGRGLVRKPHGVVSTAFELLSEAGTKVKRQVGKGSEGLQVLISENSV